MLAPALSDRPSDAALACLVLGGGAGPWRVPLVRLAGAACELWPAAGRVAEGRIAEASWRADGERCVVSIELPCEPPEAASEEAYRRLFHVLDALGYPHLLRTWNYLPGITAGEGEEERYRAFVRGRARAFAERLAPGAYPAATAVGCAGEHLLLHALAARSPGTALENPRQVPAWRYPPRYGKVAPAFARAVLLGDGLMLVSGTASIVGHRSRHAGELRQQLAEARRNLETLCAVAARRAGPGRLLLLRVYLRDQERLPELLAGLPAEPTRVVLAAEICRRELLVELEGVWAGGRGAAASDGGPEGRLSSVGGSPPAGGG
ncbi:MAG: pteridine-dependent deoxygenase [Xanthomonadales bacterium]|nr:pteridine-dependent deoxygenase [Xanthomonadales bacterium]